MILSAGTITWEISQRKQKLQCTSSMVSLLKFMSKIASTCFSESLNSALTESLNSPLTDAQDKIVNLTNSLLESSYDCETFQY